jgi:error-prone DNA polymerase
MTASLLLVRGTIQSESGVIHVVAESFEDLSPHLARLRDEPGAPPPEIRSRVSGRLVRSRDFH